MPDNHQPDHAARVREAKPCPWCGSTMPPTQRETDGSKWGALSCAECSAIGPETRTGYGPFETWYADALAEWNNRPGLDALLAAERERSEERIIGAVGHGIPLASIGASPLMETGELYDARCVRALLDRAMAEERARCIAVVEGMERHHFERCPSHWDEPCNCKTHVDRDDTLAALRGTTKDAHNGR